MPSESFLTCGLDTFGTFVDNKLFWRLVIRNHVDFPTKAVALSIVLCPLKREPFLMCVARRVSTTLHINVWDSDPCLQN